MNILEKYDQFKFEGKKITRDVFAYGDGPGVLIFHELTGLTPACVRRELGIVSDERWNVFNAKYEAVAKERSRLESIFVKSANTTAAKLLKRPEQSYRDVVALPDVTEGDLTALVSGEQREQVALQLEVQAKYSGYIERQATKQPVFWTRVASNLGTPPTSSTP